MYSPNEQFAELSRATCESALKIAAVSLDKAERFSKLNLQAARVVLEQTVHNGSAVRGIKDAQGMEALRVKLSELGVQNAIAYSKGVYQIASETQTDFSELAEQAWSSYAEDVTAWAEKAAKNAPAGSDVALTAFKSSIAATTAAFDQFSKSSKQMVSIADASARAAAANAASVAKVTSITKKSKKGRKTA